MSKRRKNNHSLSPPQEIKKTMDSMRGLVKAARVPSTRRLITPAKAMARINELVKRTEDGYYKVSHHKRTIGQGVPDEAHGRLKADQRQLPRQVLPSQVRFLYDDARRALVCAARADRREVLFALRRTGKNGHRNRKAVWTPLSYVSCKKRG